jgi:hypothetical protein
MKYTARPNLWARMAILEAFVAKAVYNFPTTKMLIAYLHDSKNLRRLCGWESKGGIPSESTFSRSFEEFSRGGLGEKIHEAMVKQHAGPKLAGHVSRDATQIYNVMIIVCAVSTTSEF